MNGTQDPTSPLPNLDHIRAWTWAAQPSVEEWGFIRSNVLRLVEEVEHLRRVIYAAEAAVIIFRRDAKTTDPVYAEAAERLNTILEVSLMRGELSVLDFIDPLADSEDL